jgi:6-phospho-beta-glucosidase
VTTKICIVGGGSAYMPGIAFAFAHLGERFAGTTVVLQDIDADALELQGRLTRSILGSRGAAGIRVETSVDRLRALEGADLVLTAFRPGGFEARHLDERIAIDHGVIGQETAGPGGVSMALRSVPVVLDILGEVGEIAAPGCLVLNYTNPVQIVSEAVARFAPDVPFVGLCDQTSGEIHWLARLLGVAPASVEIDTCGTNHMTFTRAVRIDGVDETTRVWDVLDAIPLGDLADDAERRIVRLFRILRHIPSEYLQYFFFHDEVLAEQRAKGITRAQEVMAELPGVVASYRREADSAQPRPSMARASEEHGDFAVSIMGDVLAAHPGRHILNLPNRGQIDDLPSGAIVETPAVVRGRAFDPIPQGALPPEVSGLIRQVAEHAHLAAEAAATADRSLLVKAMALHPLVRSIDLSERLVGAYLEAHGSYLSPPARSA